MILVGIIPGPHEPRGDINSYLTPLVLDLKDFENGVQVPCMSASGRYFSNIIVRIALVGVFCDLTATRKVCGFVSHNAIHGCSRCLKRFNASKGRNRQTKMDYSGYDKSSWPERDIAKHREFMCQVC